ncbi:O-antigen ligase family protein [Halovulum sp. GXIMD14794]
MTRSEEKYEAPGFVKLFLVFLLIPIFFDIGQLSMSFSKLFFIFVTPYLVIKILSSKEINLNIIDYLIFFFCFWNGVSILRNHNPSIAVEFTGSISLTLLGGYLMGRMFLTDKFKFIGTFKFLSLIILISLPFSIHEVITSKPIITTTLSSLGFDTHKDINHDPRMGLWRAQFIFVHPIHYGLFCASLFSIIFYGARKATNATFWFMMSASLAICCFLSLSSGPLLSLLVQFALIFWALVTRNLEKRWAYFWVLLAILYVVIEILSDRSGIYAVVERMTFNKQNAYVRLVLFEYGIEQIGREPIFGVGYNPWPLPTWMTGSIDNYWLMAAVLFGLPAFVAIFGAFIITMLKVGARDFSQNPELNLIRRGWIFSVVGLMLTLGTVAIWGEVYSFALFILGSGAWMISTETVTSDAPAAARPLRTALPYSRGAPARPNALGVRRD